MGFARLTYGAAQGKVAGPKKGEVYPETDEIYQGTDAKWRLLRYAHVQTRDEGG